MRASISRNRRTQRDTAARPTDPRLRAWWRRDPGPDGSKRLRLRPPAAKGRGQSLVEFALIVPVLMLIVLTALDFGRVFMGWVVLNNAARVGASYAALNTDAWGPAKDDFKQAQYVALVRDARDDAGAVLGGCEAETVPNPDFSGFELGDHVAVELDCGFQPITPLLGDILTSGGMPLTVSARSVFPVRTGGIAVSMPTPPPVCLSDFTYTTDGLTAHFQDTTAGGPTSWFWVFEGPEATAEQHPSYAWDEAGTYTVTLDAGIGSVPCTQQIKEVTVAELPTPDPDATPTPAPSPSAEPQCIVPGLAGRKKNNAQGIWNSAGFTTAVQLVDGASTTANWTIEYQSLNGNNAVACNVTIVIGPDPLPTPAP